MKQILLLLAVTGICSKAISQRINKPHWTQEGIEFVAAKIKVSPGSSTKVLFNGYKQSTISINNDQQGQVSNISIDVPDYCFIRSGTVNTVEYISNSKMERVSYTIIEGKKMAQVTIVYMGDFVSISDGPSHVFVIFSDNADVKPMKTISIQFTEIK